MRPPAEPRSNSSFLFHASQKMEEAAAKAAIEEHRRKTTQLDLQDRYRLDLEREKMVTAVPESGSHHPAPLSLSCGLTSVTRHMC